MKPTFALDFRDGQVTLLHRTSRGWTLVGSAAFDAPDFPEALAYLRSTAMGLSPRGITTKLILPNDQVLYTEVEVGAADGPRRRRLIRLALDGRTPYAVDDLAWDWSGAGPTVKVAVIAKETLAEAEAFATEHRFNPVSFVAVPGAGQFEGEAFFGPTSAAPQILGEADKVERDAEPVEIVAHVPPKPEPGLAVTEADLAPPVLDARDLEAEADEGAASESAPPESAPPVSATPVSAPPGEATPGEVSAEDPVLESPPAEAAEQVAAPPAEAQAPAMAAPGPAPLAPRTEVEEAPMALDVVADPAVEDDLPPAPAAAILAARKAAGGAADLARPVEPAAEEARSGAATDPRSIGGVSRPGAVPRPSLAKAPAKAEAKPETGRGATLAFPGKAGKARGKQAGVTAATIAGMPARERNVVPLPVATAAEGVEASAKPARPNPVLKGRPQIGGKPRYLGLALTVGLLLLLAAIAVWSSFFLGTSEATAPTSGTPTADPAASLAPTDPGSTTQQANAGEPPGNVEAASGVVAEATPGAAQGTGPETGPETAATTTTASTMGQAAAPLPDAAGTPGDAGATAASAPASSPDTTVAGVTAPLAASASDGGAAVKLASADTPPGVTPPQALAPLAAGADAEPAAPPAPPPFGTVYKFDDKGLIIPTPEGILTPEGVLLVAGKPKPLPPERPAALTVAPPAEPPATTPAPAPTDPVPPDPGAIAIAPAQSAPLPAADPTLEGKRPAPRPAGLAPTPDQQGAAETSPADPRLAALRPAARPADLVPPAPAAPDPAAAASLVASGAPLLTAPVTRSPRPPERPTDLSRSVDDAVTAALNQPAEPPAQEPVVQDEPEPDTRQPNLPTNASVAKQATDKNAMNTNKLALLAVFGTTSSRFAMVRQPNGAVKKVRVGDSVDGGKVAAITANAIQLQKGGRMITLALPSG